jgi:hypothetical protein
VDKLAYVVVLQFSPVLVASACCRLRRDVEKQFINNKLNLGNDKHFLDVTKGDFLPKYPSLVC